MSRLPIRARLTAVFAAAMIVVLAGAAAFVYVRLRADLDEGIDEALRADAAQPRGEPEDAFSQLLARDGRLLRAAGGARGPVLTRSEIERAAGGPVVVERRVAGIDGRARIRAVPRGDGVFVAGRSLEDRDETLAGLLASFAAGGAVALLVTSLLGYALAATALAPIEAMRRQAALISLTDDQEGLPLPDARDEVRRLGETLNAMLDRLRRAFERERQFVADASHELRTPIATLKTELDGALRTAASDGAARPALLAAVEECDRLAQLAEDLLVLARAGDGRLAVRPERRVARSVLEGARERFADRAAEHGRTIRVASPDGLTVDADPLRIRQALGNLVDNALRHGAGEVTLRALRRDGDDATVIEVADEGSGFDDEFAPHAFERFTRGDESRSGRGSGLGLAIVAAIAEAHGGEAHIRGPGVSIRLPSQAGLSTRP